MQVGALIKVDHDSSSRLLKNAVKHLRQCHQYLQPVRKFPEFQRVDGKLVIDPEDLNHRRQWAPPLTEDVNCTSRAFETKAAAMLCLGACPLAKLVSDCFGRDPLQSPTSNVGGSNDVLEKRDANGQLLKLWLQKLCGPHADPNFRFASLPPSQRTLSRLLDELSLFLSSPVAGETLQEVVQPTRLAKLVDALRVQGQEDMREATALVTGVVEGANCGNAKDWLLRRCGTAVHVSFSSLVAALMASEPGCSDALYRANQELREDKLSSLFEKVAQALALIVRVGQVTRAMEKALDLQSAISRRSEALIVSLKARTLSEELLAKRHHSRAKRASVLFDPRLLVFEFLFDIMLRETQVRILGAFLYSAKVGRSMTHQMIMGDGKTTVIAPLLALILADGKSLVCSCMPAALAEMTRSVLTRCLVLSGVDGVAVQVVLHIHVSSMSFVVHVRHFGQRMRHHRRPCVHGRGTVPGRLPRCFSRLAKPLMKPSDGCMTWDSDHSYCEGDSTMKRLLVRVAGHRVRCQIAWKATKGTSSPRKTWKTT